MPTIPRIAARVAKEGQTATLRLASTATPAVFTDVPVRAVVRAVVRLTDHDALVGTLQQSIRRGWISNAELAAAGARPPRKGDRLVASGVTYTIQEVDTRLLRGAIAMHWLSLKG